MTPSTLPAGARLGVGTTVWLVFLTYVFTLGRRAARAGETGDVPEELTAPVPTEAA